MELKNGRVADIFYYPIQSCRGITASKVEIGERGVRHDRNWVVAGWKGKRSPKERFQKWRWSKRPSMGAITLNAPGKDACNVAPGQGQSAITVDVWGNKCAGSDEGDVIYMHRPLDTRRPRYFVFRFFGPTHRNRYYRH